MIPRQGHIKLRVSESRASVLALPSGSSFDQRSKYVKDTKKVALMFGGLDIIYTDRQTDRQTDRH